MYTQLSLSDELGYRLRSQLRTITHYVRHSEQIGRDYSEGVQVLGEELHSTANMILLDPNLSSEVRALATKALDVLDQWGFVEPIS
jgi:hypothetical protein